MRPNHPPLIAIVDDDESVCRSVGRLLKAAGMRTRSFASGEAFLSEPDTGGFDCLLFDVQLGGMSGVELQQHIREAGDATPVIFITAYDEPDTRDQAMSGGCRGFYRKTEAGSVLLEGIRDVMNERDAGGTAGGSV